MPNKQEDYGNSLETKEGFLKVFSKQGFLKKFSTDIAHCTQQISPT